MSKIINVEVKMGHRIKSTSQMIKIFCRKCKDEKIVDEVRKRSYYKSKGQKRREKKSAAIRRAHRQLEKNQKLK
jgi:ribosomal protein S21